VKESGVGKRSNEEKTEMGLLMPSALMHGFEGRKGENKK